MQERDRPAVVAPSHRSVPLGIACTGVLRCAVVAAGGVAYTLLVKDLGRLLRGRTACGQPAKQT